MSKLWSLFCGHSKCSVNQSNSSSTLYTALKGEAIKNDDEYNPTAFAEAGFFSKISFWWLNPLMKLSREKILNEGDVPKLRDTDRAESCYLHFLEEYKTRKGNQSDRLSSESSILWTIVACNWREILLSGLFALVKTLTVSAGPLLLNAFIAVAAGNEAFRYEGYVLAVTLLFAKILESVSQRQCYFKSRLIGLKVRSLLTAAIYKKQLKLSNAARTMHSSGEIMNYVTVDSYRIGEFSFWFHQIWSTGLQLCIVLLILIHAVELATTASLVVIILTVLCNMPLAKLLHKSQQQLMVAQDERLMAFSEAVSKMKILKSYAWDSHFKNGIEVLRKVELACLSRVQSLKAYNCFIYSISPVFVSAATFGACFCFDIPLHASNVFTFVATLGLVTQPISVLPDMVGVVIQAKVAFARIVRFLDAPELHTAMVRKNSCTSSVTNLAILIRSADLSWELNSSKPTLRNINLNVRKGQKLAICGEVGSGKSTLLAAILGELPHTEGAVEVYGRIAYVSQTAWIQMGTIRENVLFGSAMDDLRYMETLRRCSLLKDLDLLPYGDMTEIGERGVNLSGGQKQRIQLARALYQDADIYILDDPFSAVDAHTATSLFKEYVMDALSGKTVLLVTHQVDFLPAFDCCLMMANGEIFQAGPYNKLLATSPQFLDLVNAHKETAGPEKLAEVSASGRYNHSEQGVNKINFDFKGEEQLIKEEEREVGDTGLKPYLLYLNQNKGFWYFLIVVIFNILFSMAQVSQSSWLASSVDNPHITKSKMILVYLSIGLCSALFLLIRSLAVVTLGMQASNSLFSQMLNSLFLAPLSFYDSTPLGRILSRVSVDLSIVDLDVPFAFLFTLAGMIVVCAYLGVLAVITWQVLFVSVPLLYMSIRLQRFYLATAKELMRINGTTKSMIANHIAEAISGAMTIRAFQVEDRFFAENMNLIDKNASPFFHSFAANEWLIQRLESLSAIILSSAALCMVLLPTGTLEPGFIGMALSYGLVLNLALVFYVQSHSTLSNYIVSVERVAQYMHIPCEAPQIINQNSPPQNWPSVGEVKICNLQIKYREDGPLVLQGISCTFEGGDKVGIVGRTGSGKTTLIGALFRLVEPAGGEIIIDTIDICSIGLHDLRSRLGIIPQDPILFNGSVRFNLDPLCRYSDDLIWEVLGKCQLKEAVQGKEHGLDSTDGSNWSMGQRQLFCLGRAMLRRSRVLVLDEATASIDNATDMILQRIIRTEFADCTVITVAHRIPTVMDCTKVLAISEGKLVEYDEPMKLIKKEGSLFGQLVKEYWSHSHIHSSESH